MQEVSEEWKNMFNKRTLNESFVVLHIYDSDNNEIYKAEKEQIFSFSMTEEVSIIDEILPSNEITFSLDNHKGTFDIDNEEGLYSKLAYRNRVVVEIGYKLDSGEIEWISGGTYYLTEWTASSNSLTAEFTAKDILYFLTKNASFKYNENSKSLFSTYGDSGLTLQAVINNLSLSGVNTDFNGELSDTSTTYSYDDLTNNLLQEMAQCGKMTLWVDRDDTIHIDKVDLDADDIEDYYIDDFNSFNHPEITLESPIDEIDIDYIVSSNSPETYSNADENTNIILASGNSTTTTPFVCQSNAELGYMVSSNRANWLEGGTTPSSVNTSKNSMTIGFGSSTTNSFTIYALTLQETSYTYSYTLSSGDTVQTISNPFITSESVAEQNAEWVGKYYSYRRVVECSFRADPRLDPLDIIEVYKKYGGTERVIVEYIKYEWSGGMFHGTMRGRSLGNYHNDFATDSWELIDYASKHNPEKYYNVGDKKTITLTTNEKIEVRIVGFNHDTKVSGGTAGISIEMVDLLSTTYQYNSTSTNSGGWEASLLRSTLNSDVFATLPSDLQEVIKLVKKKTSTGYHATGVVDSEDKLWVVSMAEIFSQTAIENSARSTIKDYSDIYTQEGSQYEFYKNLIGDTDPNDPISDLRKKRNGSYYYWWFRSPYFNNSDSVWCYNYNGTYVYNLADVSYGVALGFCI